MGYHESNDDLAASQEDGSMLHRFTMGARHVVVLAREEARVRRHDLVTPEHVLLALVRDGVGMAVHAMQRLGLDPGTARVEAERALAGRAEVPAEPEPAFAPETKRVLELAVRSARELGHHRVGTESLLLALVEEGHSEAARILASHGLTPERARREAKALLDAQAALSEEHLRLVATSRWRVRLEPASGTRAS
jgi:ATP-dependent Clp protease ATP-binding subunit ClpC